MNEFERSKRNHPAQIHKDRRTLELMEHYYDETAPEVVYTKRRKRRRKQELKQARSLFAMVWRF